MSSGESFSFVTVLRHKYSDDKIHFLMFLQFYSWLFMCRPQGHTELNSPENAKLETMAVTIGIPSAPVLTVPSDNSTLVSSFCFPLKEALVISQRGLQRRTRQDLTLPVFPIRRLPWETSLMVSSCSRPCWPTSHPSWNRKRKFKRWTLTSRTWFFKSTRWEAIYQIVNVF